MTGVDGAGAETYDDETDPPFRTRGEFPWIGVSAVVGFTLVLLAIVFVYGGADTVVTSAAPTSTTTTEAGPPGQAKAAADAAAASTTTSSATTSSTSTTSTSTTTTAPPVTTTAAVTVPPGAVDPAAPVTVPLPSGPPSGSGRMLSCRHAGAGASGAVQVSNSGGTGASFYVTVALYDGSGSFVADDSTSVWVDPAATAQITFMIPAPSGTTFGSCGITTVAAQ